MFGAPFALCLGHHSPHVWGTVCLHLLPKAILRSPPVSVKKKRVVMATLISQRLKRWSTDNDVFGLWKEALSDCSHPTLKKNQGPSALDGTPAEGADSLAASNAVRALRWAREGRYGNAVRALESLGTAAFSDDLAWAELLKHHPSNNLPSFDDDIPSSLTTDNQDVVHALHGFRRGSSPGGSGLRAQYLLDAICGHSAPAAQDCLHALTVLINLLLSGKAHSWLSPWLAGAPSTALRKKDSGVRSIAVGEVVRRLTSRICCSAVRPRLVDILLPYGQVGVGVKGGQEAAIHATCCCLHHYVSNPDLCLLKLDMRNAFNECDRSVFLEKVKACLPELFGWAQWCYTFPAELRFGRRRILSLSGVQQGDPLGPLLFSLVLTSLFDRIPPTPNVLLSLWYLDDGTIIGSRPAVLELLHHIETLGPSFGLFLNKKKCELYWPAGDQSFSDFPSEIRRPSAGLDLLGSPVWGSEEFYNSYFASKVDRTLHLHSLLSSLEDPQCELHLLRSCLSICKIFHLLRTVPPDKVVHQLHAFDDGLRRFLERILCCSVCERSWLQASLPLCFGGLGLRASFRTAPAAFLASCHSSFPLIQQLLSGCSFEDLHPHSIPGVQSAFEHFQNFLPNWSAPDSPTQTSLQAALDTDQLHQLLNASTIRDRAHLNSIYTGQFTSSWLQAIPNPNLGLAIIGCEFTCALRYWLSIPFFDSSHLCSCGSTLDPHGDHLLGCGQGPFRIRCHDVLTLYFVPSSPSG